MVDKHTHLMRPITRARRYSLRPWLHRKRDDRIWVLRGKFVGGTSAAYTVIAKLLPSDFTMP
jgi:hypothetical protein